MSTQAERGEQLEAPIPPQAEVERVAREFTRVFHDLKKQTFATTTWLGTPLVKTPNDIVVFQQIITETRPNLIIETGVYLGGGALLFATLMDLLGIEGGRVVAIDVDLGGVRQDVIDHPRIELIEGSSTDPAVVSRLRSEAEGKRVMVDLDSDHRAHHVLEELRAYSPMVTPGCYLVVEDGFLGGRPVRPDAIPGPSEALDAWFGEEPPFESDRWHERYLLTQNPRGYMRRIDGDAGDPRPPRPDSFLTGSLELSGETGANGRAPTPAPEHALETLQAQAGAPEGELDALRRTIDGMARGERKEAAESELERRRTDLTVEGLLSEIDAQREVLLERNRMLARERSRLRRITESGPYRIYRKLRSIPGLRSYFRWRDRQRLSEAKARMRGRSENRQQQGERFVEHHRGQ